MTERRRPIPIAAIAGGLFCLVLIYLALQIRAGNDPAIGAGHQAAAAPAPRKVIVRRVVIRRIVEEGAPAAGAAPAVRASAPAVSAPAPAAAAPVPAAPAPAPVVTRGS